MSSSTSPQAHNNNNSPDGANLHTAHGTAAAPVKVAKTRNRVINSCLMCRKRKVRCDRTMPTCMTCLRGNHVCTYEDRALKNMKAKEEAGLGANGAGKSNLNERIQRLEKLVAEATRLARLSSMDGGESTEKTAVEEQQETPPEEDNTSKEVEVVQKGASTAGGLRKQVAEDLAATEKERGKGTLLLEDGGNARFVSPLYWALLEEEAQEIERLHNDESSPSSQENHDSPDYGAPPSQANSNDSDYDPLASMVFGTTYLLNDLMLLYPSSLQQAMNLYNVFLTNVDPMLRVIHPPTMNIRFAAYMKGRYTFTVPPCKSFEPLVFSIMFGAARSMTPEQGEREFGEPLENVIARLRRGAELALAKAEFLTTMSLETLTGFVMILTFLCREDDVGRVWSLVGLAFRIAQQLGLHRDPTLFPSHNMDVIQVELRRRLWHQLCILDFRTAESTGQQPMTTDDMSDTLFPSNVNNIDLVEGVKPPTFEEARELQEKEGFTDMTMQIIRISYARCYRKLIRVVYQDVALQPTGTSETRTKGEEKSYSDMEKEMKLLYDEMSDRHRRLYLRHCGVVNLLERCTLGLAYVLEWKFWIMFYHRFSVRYREKAMPLELRKEVVMKSILLIESLNLVTKDQSVQQFKWHMDSHAAFHALRHALTEITSPGFQLPELEPLRERAWAALDDMVTFFQEKQSFDWVNARRMVAQAKRANGRESRSPPAGPPEGSIQRVDELMLAIAPERMDSVLSIIALGKRVPVPAPPLLPVPPPTTASVEQNGFAASNDIDMINATESPFGFIPFTFPLNDDLSWGLWENMRSYEPSGFNNPYTSYTA